jgi:hypothetical protein
MIPDPCSITLITSLNTPSLCYWTVRYGSNNQFDFVESVKAMIAVGALLNGDSLVCDNAAVHIGADSRDELNKALADAGVDMFLLPTYSPELNPCELVFARIKNYMRSSAAVSVNWDTLEETSRSFDDLLASATTLISRESMEKTYRHCRELDPNSQVAGVLIRLGLINPP